MVLVPLSRCGWRIVLRSGRGLVRSAGIFDVRHPCSAAAIALPEFYPSSSFPGGTHIHFCTSASSLSDRLYTKSHEWLTVDGSVGTVGISNHAQEALGDIVYVELPDVDREVHQSEEVANLESVKATSAVMSPVSGRVTEKNEQVETEPSLLNSSPHEQGWLFKLELNKADEELASLMDQSAYEKLLKESKDD